MGTNRGDRGERFVPADDEPVRAVAHDVNEFPLCRQTLGRGSVDRRGAHALHSDCSRRASLGHSFQTTSIYTHFGQEQKREMIEKLHQCTQKGVRPHSPIEVNKRG